MLPFVSRTAPAVASVAVIAAVVSAPLAAQPSAASAAVAGLAGAGAAHAGLAGASALNPALLALPGAPRLTIQLPTLDAGFSFDPIGLSTIGKYEGSLVPADVREDWLARIREAGAQQAGLATSVRALGLQFGRWALSAGTTVGMRASLPPEAAQLMLFGNVDRTGALEDVAIHGGNARAWAVSSASLSHARRLPGAPFGGALSVGVTASYLLGHAFADAGAIDALVAGKSGTVRGHATAITWGDSVSAEASGYGVDVGAGWTRGRLTLGLTLQNVVNTLRFDAANAFIRERDLHASADSSHTESRDGMMGEFDATTRAHAESVAEAARFKPATRVAARFAVTSRWDVVADAALQADPSTALVAGPRKAYSLGTDLRLLSFFSLRGGVGLNSDDSGSHTAFAGGFGLRIGAFALDAGVARQTGNGPDAMRVAVGTSLQFGR
jgi:hypothetical protein